MSNKTKVWLATALSLILVGILIFGGVMSMLGWNFKKLSTVTYETHRYEVGEAYKSVSVITDTADIVFLPSADSKTSVICYEQQNMAHAVAVKDGTLAIEMTDTRKWYEHIGITFDSPKITVYLPQGDYASLAISENTGDVKVPKDFRFESLNISATTGDVANSASVSGAVKIKTSTGDICVENTEAGSLDLSVSTGNITISHVACEGDVNAYVSTGKTKVIDITCQNVISSGDTGDILLENTLASGAISLERGTGDVVLKKSDASSLLIKTDTGSVMGSLLSDKVFIAQSDTGRVNVPKTTIGGRCEIITDTGGIHITIAE